MQNYIGFYQVQFYQQLHCKMLKRLALTMHNIAKLSFQNAYFRSAHKANQDLYQLLGVSKNADPKQIKKAYYKLAQEYHPDKNSSPQAKEKFTKINNAYEILSDSSKKQMYDQTGNTGEGNAAGYNQYNQNFNQEDIFNQFKGFNQRSKGNAGGFEDILKDIFGGGGGFNTRQSKQQHGQNQPSMMNLSLSFEQSVKGCTKVLQYERKCTCAACNGSRAKQGTQPEKCKSCDGSGMQTIRQGMFVMQTTCGSCGGEGSKIKHHCTNCSGTGVQKKKAKQQITIPRGISDGMTLKLSNKGNFNNDLYIKVHVKKSSVFNRQGNNVISEIQISVIDAILGAQKQILTIQGHKKKVKIPAGLQPNQKITMKNEGFHMVNSNNKGDHIITVKIVIPKSISNEEQTLYKQLKTISK